ncbi:MAG: hypothetical protein GX630_04940 [Actinobacteria bacterium]|nr:hypothetical protein [Actinomycetota bacterium]
MTTKIHDLNLKQLTALLAGDAQLQARLAAGETFRVRTPFTYPGRLGAVTITIGPRPEPDPEPEPDDEGRTLDRQVSEAVPPEGAPPERGPARPAQEPPAPPPPDAIRITDSGGLLKYLPEQGMELEVDMVMSRTVFHAVRQWEGGGIARGQVYLDSTAGSVTQDLWQFLQLVAEVIGLRHSKYKDALVQLEKRRETEQGVSKWRPT